MVAFLLQATLGKFLLDPLGRSRTAGCRAVVLKVMWAGCHLSRSLIYFSKCTPQLQLLLGYMEWRLRVLCLEQPTQDF